MTATVAKPYAKAIFEVALEQNSLSAWDEWLQLTCLLNAQEVVKKLLTRPLVSVEDRAASYWAVCQKTGAKLDQKLTDNMQALILLLTEHGKLSILPMIAQQFSCLRKAHEKIKDVNVISAVALDSDLQTSLQESLEKRFGQKVNLILTEDSSIIGGMIIKSDDWVLDGSVTMQLNKLKHHLTV